MCLKTYTEAQARRAGSRIVTGCTGGCHFDTNPARPGRAGFVAVVTLWFQVTGFSVHFVFPVYYEYCWDDWNIIENCVKMFSWSHVFVVLINIEFLIPDSLLPRYCLHLRLSICLFVCPSVCPSVPIILVSTITQSVYPINPPNLLGGLNMALSWMVL